MHYRFNGYDIDTLQFKLTYLGTPISLEPKVFDLLIYLIEHRERTVTRDELFENVWKDQVVGDTTLSNHIKSARKALGDDGESQQVITTIRGRGYQFIAGTEVIEETEIQSEPTTSNKQNNLYRTVIVALVLLVGILVIERHYDSIIDNHPKRIAILPLTNLQPTSETDYLSFAIADQIVGNLVYVDHLTVRASGLVRQFEGKHVDPKSVGDLLNVEYLLMGSYEKSAGLTINLELIDIQSDELVWREKIEIDAGEAFGLQNDITRNIARRLDLHFTPENQARFAKDTPQSALAYDYYLRAIAFPLTIEGAIKALSVLEKSLKLDPEFAPALTEKAQRIHHLAVFYLESEYSVDDAEMIYRQALVINSESKQAIAGLAEIYTERGEVVEAITMSKKLLELNPKDADAHYSLGFSYRYAGMLEESVTEMETAIALDPNNPSFDSLGHSYYELGKFDKAFMAFEPNKNAPISMSWQATILYHQGKIEQSLAYIERLNEREPDNFWSYDMLALKAIIQDEKPLGLDYVRKLENSDVTAAEPLAYWASYYAKLGDKAGCIRLMKRAIDNGYFNYPFFLNEPFLESVRQEPEFQRLLLVVKQKHLDFKAKYF